MLLNKFASCECTLLCTSDSENRSEGRRGRRRGFRRCCLFGVVVVGGARVATTTQELSSCEVAGEEVLIPNLIILTLVEDE